MIPKKMMGVAKTPVGKDEEGGSSYMPEPQERYEEEGQRIDVVGGFPAQDPTDLVSSDYDHTPNFTKEARKSKPLYGRYEGRGSGGVGL